MSTTAAPTTRRPRKMVTINEKKKDAFAIGVSADNYHFITKLAEANGSNRTATLNLIINQYAARALSGIF